MYKWKIFEWEMFDEATNERSLGQRRRRDDGDKIAMLADYRCRTYISIKYTDRVEDDVLMLRACVIVCNFLQTHTHLLVQSNVNPCAHHIAAKTATISQVARITRATHIYDSCASAA